LAKLAEPKIIRKELKRVDLCISKTFLDRKTTIKLDEK
jgi:hypothetical protein